MDKWTFKDDNDELYYVDHQFLYILEAMSKFMGEWKINPVAHNLKIQKILKVKIPLRNGKFVREDDKLVDAYRTLELQMFIIHTPATKQIMLQVQKIQSENPYHRDGTFDINMTKDKVTITHHRPGQPDVVYIRTFPKYPGTARRMISSGFKREDDDDDKGRAFY